MSNAYKFNPKSTQNTPPRDSFTDTLDKAFGDEPLTREEKDLIAQRLYGVLGAGGSTYKRLGWAWTMSQAKQMRRILVARTHEPDTFKAFYAPDKSSLRRVLDDIEEMIDTSQLQRGAMKA